MYINTFNSTGNWLESDMYPPTSSPTLLITSRTRDFSPVQFTIFIEYNSHFFNIDPLHFPRPSKDNDIRFFNWYLMQYYLVI